MSAYIKEKPLVGASLLEYIMIVSAIEKKQAFFKLLAVSHRYRRSVYAWFIEGYCQLINKQDSVFTCRFVIITCGTKEKFFLL